MADQDIKIAIGTTADTKGLIEATTGISRMAESERNLTSQRSQFLSAAQAKVAEVNRLVEASKRSETQSKAEFESLLKSRRELDVAEAKSRTARKAALGELPAATAIAGQGVANLSGLFTQAGYQVTDFAVQVQMGQSAITAFSQQFPQLLGAVQMYGSEVKKLGTGILSMSIGAGTALSGIAVAAGIGAQLVGNAYKEMTAAQAGAAKSAENLKNQHVQLGEVRRQVLNMQREQAIARVYAKQAEDLERQAAAMERMQGIRAAQGALAGARADAAVTMASNAGGDVAGAKQAALEVDMANQLREVGDTLAKSEQAAEQAALAAQEAQAKMNDALESSGEFSDKYKELSAAWEKAAEASDQANLDLAAEREKFTLAKETIAATIGAELDSLRTETEGSITSQAKELQAKVAAMAPAAFSQASAGLDELGQILADGEVKGAREVAMLRNAIIRITNSQEGRDGEVLKTLGALENLNRALVSQIKPMADRIRNLETQAKIISSRIR